MTIHIYIALLLEVIRSAVLTQSAVYLLYISVYIHHYACITKKIFFKLFLEIPFDNRIKMFINSSYES